MEDGSGTAPLPMGNDWAKVPAILENNSGGFFFQSGFIY